MSKTFSAKRPQLIPSIIAAIMLILALAPWPYSYYKLLRIVICCVGVYMAFMAYGWQKLWASWLFGLIAVLFNPLIPINLPRELWQPVDLVSAVLFFSIGLIMKEPEEISDTDLETEVFATGSSTKKDNTNKTHREPKFWDFG